MFTDPASKVSVPLDVVTRTAVKAAPRLIEPPVVTVFASDLANTPLATQIFESIFVITIEPCITFPAPAIFNPNPAVKAAEPTTETSINELAPKYPEVV